MNRESGCGDEREYPAGIRWTKQRKDVCRVLLEAGEPLSAVQIYRRVDGNGAAEYAISTIYRILSVFEEKGFVTRSTWMGDDTVVYEWNRGGHTHYAVCLGCRKRVALPACPLERTSLNAAAGEFIVTGHRLELFGYCAKCRKILKTGEKQG